MIPLISKKQMLFIHIPKTGGTSIKTVLNEKGCDKWNRDPKFINHDPLFILIKNNKLDNDVFKFTVVRNPYKRAFSYFKHFKRVNNFAATFLEFLILIKLKGAQVFYPNMHLSTPMIFFDQSFYLYDLVDKTIKIDKIYKFENIEELEDDFKINLPHKNKGEYSAEEYFKSYNNNEIQMVEEIYSRDFTNFNYSFNFN